MAFLKALLAVLALLVAGPALAANCAPYPYTLLNGTTADANLVMADFNSILNCANNNLAKNGANSDITSLSALTTPLSTAQGGTGGTFTPANRAGDTFTGEVVTAASNVTNAGLNLPHGAAPAAPVNGDMWTTTLGAFARINGVTTPLGPNAGVFLVQLQRASGVANGDAPVNSVWATRLLNTTVVNTISGASLSSNKMTLPAGTYRVSATVFTALTGVTLCRARMQNTTAATTLLQGVDTFNFTDPNWVSNLRVDGVFTMASSGDAELQTRCTVNAASAGGMGTGDVEVYANVLLEKIG